MCRNGRGEPRRIRSADEPGEREAGGSEEGGAVADTPVGEAAEEGPAIELPVAAPDPVATFAAAGAAGDDGADVLVRVASRASGGTGPGRPGPVSGARDPRLGSLGRNCGMASAYARSLDPCNSAHSFLRIHPASGYPAFKTPADPSAGRNGQTVPAPRGRAGHGEHRRAQGDHPQLMDRIALVFPGQGSQSVGMGKTLAAASPAASAIFAEADDALGESISRLAFDGPAEQLDLTINAQPALVAVSIAFLAALRERWAAAGVAVPEPAYAAGHSMGQYSAMVAAGVIGLGDAVRLVRERGRQMQASGKGRAGAMAAMIGLDDARLPELIALGTPYGSLTVANRNAPGQVVISGDRAAVEAAVAGARDLGARRGIVLPVSVAAHSPLMAEAATGMTRVLEPIAFADPTIPLLTNADARPIATAAEARRELVEHLTRGVDWVAAVQRMTAEGVTTFVEVGPGKVLTGLIKRIAPEADCIAVDEAGAPGGIAVPFFEDVTTIK
jgi:[acyl-carrier-protein] S-malonyltransferase